VYIVVGGWRREGRVYSWGDKGKKSSAVKMDLNETERFDLLSPIRENTFSVCMFCILF
jgi:hypothetical protein